MTSFSFHASRLLTLTMAFMLSTSAFALKVGVVDLQMAVTQSPQFQRAQTELRQQFEPKQQALITKAEALKKQVAEFQKNQSVMTPEQTQAKQQALMQEDQKLQLEQKQIQQQVNQRRSLLMNQVEADIKQQLDALANEKNLDLVLIKGVSAAYHKPELDITQTLLDRLSTNK